MFRIFFATLALAGFLLAATRDFQTFESDGYGDWQIQKEAVGKRSLSCSPALWNVAEFIGENARIHLVDDESGPWGFIGVNHFVFTNQPNLKLPPTTLDIPEKSATPTTEAIDPAILKVGQQQYLVCGACHGQSGEGTAAGPPLVGSEWVNGPEENLIRIQLRGLQGPITVKGQEYNFPRGMMALAYQTDEQIASVLTYIRHSFGNSAPPVNAAAIAALRNEVGKPQITAAELIPPFATKPNPEAMPTGAAATAPSSKYDHLTPKSNLPKWIAVGLGLLVLGVLAQIFRKK